MVVKLLHNTPLEVADIAISKCYAKQPYTELEKQQSRINKVANVSKHSSTIEHLVYSFDIDGISRAVLQELARHRIASYTVKSTRYTLSELKKEKVILLEDIDSDLHSSVYDLPGWELATKYIVPTNNETIDRNIYQSLCSLQVAVKAGNPNDLSKYCLPEAYKTALVMTINARALQNFLSLRTNTHALWEIQDLANSMYNVVPEDHKFLFSDCVK